MYEVPTKTFVREDERRLWVLHGNSARLRQKNVGKPLDFDGENVYPKHTHLPHDAKCQCQSISQVRGNSMPKIILDTDIGSDVDDALALALILSSPEAELLGVSTVHGDTRRRATVAHQMAAAFGKTFAVAPGLGDERLLGGAQLILDQLHRHPDATVLAIGPLSNLAACVDAAPERMRAAHIVIMGGMAGCAFPEGNIASDPEAAERVFSSGADITMLSLDVTLKAVLPYSFIQRLAAHTHPAQRMLHRMILEWRDEFLIPFIASQNSTLAPGDPFTTGLHDPMAVAAALHPDWFCWRPAEILIETRGQHTRGVSIDRKNVFTGHVDAPNCKLATSIDQAQLMRWIEDLLLREE